MRNEAKHVLPALTEQGIKTRTSMPKARFETVTVRTSDHSNTVFNILQITNITASGLYIKLVENYIRIPMVSIS